MRKGILKNLKIHFISIFLQKYRFLEIKPT